MKIFFCSVFVGLLCLPACQMTKEQPPTVQVYSRTPGVLGKENILICHVSGFHPPEITIELLKNDQPMSNTKQTDLAFEENWYYHLTKHVSFTPAKGEKFGCKVTHMGQPKTFYWDPDM